MQKATIKVFICSLARGIDSNLNIDNVRKAIAAFIDTEKYDIATYIGEGAEGESDRSIEILIDNAPMKIGGYYVFLSIPDEYHVKFRHNDHSHISGSLNVTEGTCFAIGRFGSCIQDCFGTLGADLEGDTVNYTVHPDGSIRKTDEDNILNEPMQPIYMDKNGVVRFAENKIVKYLSETPMGNLNNIAGLSFSDRDRRQFAQLIGYSVSGYGDLPYVTTEHCELADKQAEPVIKKSRKKAEPLNIKTTEVTTKPPRACEICGKNDIKTSVHSSSVGAVSFNYCECCDAVRAEPKYSLEFDPTAVWYKHADDKYYQNGNPIPTIYTIGGVKMDLPTRSDLAKHCTKSEPEEKTDFDKFLETNPENFDRRRTVIGV